MTGGGTEAARFIEVGVEPCAASEDGLHLRFKVAGTPRAVKAVPYESEAGLAGSWEVTAVEEDETPSADAPRGVLVEDSSDGVAWLIVGGRGGLLLVHPATGARVREPYLLLSRTTALS
jgi:hypothetical protein